MGKNIITIVTHQQLLNHDTGGGDHPEVPARLLAISEKLMENRLTSKIKYVQSNPASREWLLTFHTESWLFRFEEEVLSGRSYISHPDNQVCYETYQAALLSTGSGITGVDLIEKDANEIVFCSTRPPGHHAEAGMPYGFCFLNNCVIATRYWQRKYNRKRICVFDFDAHHGNGIQSALEEDEETLYISIHEHPSFSFPGTGWEEEDGVGPGTGTILNIPLQPGATDKHVLRELQGRIAQKISEFRPEAFVIAAGFDGHISDDMSDLHYSTEIFRELGKQICSWAQEYSCGRLLSVLEGGYHLPSLGESVEAYLDGLQSAMGPPG